jgi:hypothetical protein
MPTWGLINRFVKERFDKTLKMTPVYAQYSREAGYQATAAISMKQLNGTIAFAGSNIPSAFTEFAADWYIVDELDRCDQANLEMGWERLSAAEERYRRQAKVSNPTITGYGIDLEYAKTNQMHWHIKHDCGKYVTPDFFKHVVRQTDDNEYEYCDGDYEPDSDIDARLICHHCGRPMNRRGGGEWIASYPKAKSHGYQISKMFSANVRLTDLVGRFDRGLVDPDSMVRFYNGDLGLPFDSPGARITKTALDEAKQDYFLNIVPQDGICVAGVDVGAVYNVTIGHMGPGVPGVRLVAARTIALTDDLKSLMMEYHVKVLVIDALPETRESKRIAAWIRNGFVCYYGGARTEKINRDRSVSVERTAALDQVKCALYDGGLTLPQGAENIPEFYEQMMASTRMLDPDAHGGEGAYVWREGSKADHYFHACGYMMIASRILAMLR